MVTDVDEGAITVQHKDGRTERIVTATKIWAAGVQASSLGRTLSEQTGAPLDRAGRISVNPDLTLPGHPEVFVVGDMISLDNLPGVAQVAIQGAKYAAKKIDGRLKGNPPQRPFHYFDKGSMAIISRFRAVAMVGKLRLTGVIAWLMWLGGAPRLHHRLQEPRHRAAALGHLVPRPRSLRADHHRAAGLRPGRARPAQGRRRGPRLDARAPTTRRTRCSRCPGARSSRRRRARRRGSPTRTSAASTWSSVPADRERSGSEVGTVVAQHPHEVLRLDHRGVDDERVVVALLDDDLPPGARAGP